MVGRPSKNETVAIARAVAAKMKMMDLPQQSRKANNYINIRHSGDAIPIAQ
jgi:hypothetical protein